MYYYRLKYKVNDRGQTRTVWAQRINPPNPGDTLISRYNFIWFRRVLKNGNTAEPIELIGLTTEDIIFIDPAKMNLHYAELEIIPKGE